VILIDGGMSGRMIDGNEFIANATTNLLRQRRELYIRIYGSPILLRLPLRQAEAIRFLKKSASSFHQSFRFLKIALKGFATYLWIYPTLLAFSGLLFLAALWQSRFSCRPNENTAEPQKQINPSPANLSTSNAQLVGFLISDGNFSRRNASSR
jgi:hypothetical protein